MASVAVLSRSSLVKSAVCNHGDFVSQKSPQRVSGCPSLVGKRMTVKRELSVRERRASTFRAKAKVGAETAVPAESASDNKPKAKVEAETAVPAQSAIDNKPKAKAEAETAVPAQSASDNKPKAKVEAETAVPAESASDNKPKAKVGAETAVPAESASDDSIVPEVANLKEEADTAGVAPKKRVGPLSKGGTLTGAAAAGKAPADATLGKAPALTAMGKFQDPRWKDGNWDLAQFTANGKTDWDAVIDAEVVRRSWLERTPEASTNEDPVFFDTGVIPWWAWVRRFHLPEAEKLNGRAAMVGYAAGWLVDAASGVGLVDQQGSFFGKLLLLITVIGVLVVRKNEDLTNLKDLANEWTFYDKQWQATWKEGPPASGKEQSEEKKW